MSLSLYNLEKLDKKFDANRNMIVSLVLGQHGGSFIVHDNTCRETKMDVSSLFQLFPLRLLSSIKWSNKVTL